MAPTPARSRPASLRRAARQVFRRLPGTPQARARPQQPFRAYARAMDWRRDGRDRRPLDPVGDRARRHEVEQGRQPCTVASVGERGGESKTRRAWPLDGRSSSVGRSAACALAMAFITRIRGDIHLSTAEDTRLLLLHHLLLRPSARARRLERCGHLFGGHRWVWGWPAKQLARRRRGDAGQRCWAVGSNS